MLHKHLLRNTRIEYEKSKVTLGYHVESQLEWDFYEILGDDES